MREIKFRAWDKERKVMWYDGSSMITDILKSLIDGAMLISDGRSILMQYTGLKDKDGREIYEGDICRFDVAEGRKGEEAKFNKTGAVTIERGVTNFGDWGCPWCINTEVIGNIYENPELLNV